MPLYAGNQLFASDHKTFKGFYINPETVAHPIIDTAYQAGTQLGRKLFAYGYYGFFDLDLVVSKDKHPYAVEINLRRTGATYLDACAKQLLGKEYAHSHHVLGEELQLDAQSSLNYQQCKMLFSEITYSPKTKTGLIFSNPDMIEVGELSIILIASTASQMWSMRNLIRNKTGASGPSLLDPLANNDIV